jgi:hypothetical protein
MCCAQSRPILSSLTPPPPTPANSPQEAEAAAKDAKEKTLHRKAWDLYKKEKAKRDAAREKRQAARREKKQKEDEKKQKAAQAKQAEREASGDVPGSRCC